MSHATDPSDADRLAALGRLIDAQAHMLSVAFDLIMAANGRSIAIRDLLAARGVLRAAEVEDMADRMKEGADLAVELGPEYERFRAARRRIQQLSDEQERNGEEQ